MKIKIEGVLITPRELNKDTRGWLTEIYRNDEEPFKNAMAYVSHTDYGVIRGPHEHRDQIDFFAFIGYGDFKLYLWDNRKDSKTYGNKLVLSLGENNRATVLVPPGVVHGYKSISKGGSLCINLPDKLYAGKNKLGKVDEIRHEEDVNSNFKME